MTTTPISIPVPTEQLEAWIKFVTTDPVIFNPSHCGYWMTGTRPNRIEQLWLAFEHGDEHRLTEDEWSLAEARYATGGTLPEGWFVIDRALAIKAFVEGVKLWGVKWYEEGDANRYDIALQHAIFCGDAKYG